MFVCVTYTSVRCQQYTKDHIHFHVACCQCVCTSYISNRTNSFVECNTITCVNTCEHLSLSLYMYSIYKDMYGFHAEPTDRPTDSQPAWLIVIQLSFYFTLNVFFLLFLCIYFVGASPLFVIKHTKSIST